MSSKGRSADIMRASCYRLNVVEFLCFALAFVLFCLLLVNQTPVIVASILTTAPSTHTNGTTIAATSATSTATTAATLSTSPPSSSSGALSHHHHTTMSAPVASMSLSTTTTTTPTTSPIVATTSTTPLIMQSGTLATPTAHVVVALGECEGLSTLLCCVLCVLSDALSWFRSVVHHERIDSL